MTDSAQQNVDRFVERCREAGLKVTPQRLEIFRALALAPDHPTAEAVHAEVQQRMPTVALDTVYRTLTTLQRHGVIARIAVLGNSARFEANTGRHHHFVCTECGKVEDFYWPAFDRMDLPQQIEQLGIVHQPHAELRGICRECSARLADGESSEQSIPSEHSTDHNHN